MRIACLLLSFLFLFSGNAKADDWQTIPFYGNGKIHSLSEYKGKTVLVMFWATWCPYCQTQLPALSMLKKLYSNLNNFEVIAISIDDEGEQVVKNHLLTYNITNFDSYIDDKSTLLHSLGFYAIPSLVIISKDQKLLGSYSGLQHLDIKYLEEIIKKQ